MMVHQLISPEQQQNRRFGNTWISCDGPIAWPARSPELDFSFWEIVKSEAYPEEIIKSIYGTELWKLLIGFVIISGVIVNQYLGLELCIQERDRQFEHLLRYIRNNNRYKKYLVLIIIFVHIFVCSN